MKTILASAGSATAVVFAGLLMASPAALAEKADALKPVNVDYNKAWVDNVTQTSIWTGNVIVTRGTLIMKSDRAEVKETPEGYMTAVFIAGPGKLATFRQKRDGGPDLWVEGHAERIEYDERTDVVKLISNGQLRQLEGPKVTQEMNSPFISYDSRKEVLLGLNDASGVDKPGQGRGHMTFQPRRTTPAAGAAPASPAPATPAAPSPAGKQ